MNTFKRKMALGTLAAATVLTPLAASTSSASAATPYYSGGFASATKAQCESSKSAYEAKANAGGNHIVWVGNTGCVPSTQYSGMWTSGIILYSATHMVNKTFDRFEGWSLGAAMPGARSAERVVAGR